MRYALFAAISTERRMLCTLALACFSNTVISLAALAYWLCVRAIDSHGFQISAIYYQFGV